MTETSLPTSGPATIFMTRTRFLTPSIVPTCDLNTSSTARDCDGRRASFFTPDEEKRGGGRLNDGVGGVG